MVASLDTFDQNKQLKIVVPHFGIIWVVLATFQEIGRFFPNHLVTLVIAQKMR
jgi:hypothetical protein